MVVGGGPVAASKLAALQAAGADLVVIAPDVCEAIRSAGVPIVQRPFEPADLEGAWFVVAAAPPASESIWWRTRQSDGTFSSMRLTIRRTRACISGAWCGAPGVTLAISTDGAAPALAGLLREALDFMLPGDLTLAAWNARAHEIAAVMACARRADGGAAS